MMMPANVFGPVALLFLYALKFTTSWADWMNSFLHTRKRSIFAGGHNWPGIKYSFSLHLLFTMLEAEHYQQETAVKLSSTFAITSSCCGRTARLGRQFGKFRSGWYWMSYQHCGVC